MGRISFEGQNTDKILALFAGKKRDARRIYRQLVADGVERGRRSELVGGGLRRSLLGNTEPEEFQAYDERILGG